MAEGTKISFIRSIYSGGTAMDYFDKVGCGGLDVVGGADDISVDSIFGHGPPCKDDDDIKCECVQDGKPIDCKDIEKDESFEIKCNTDDNTVEIDMEIGIHDDNTKDIDTYIGIYNDSIQEIDIPLYDGKEEKKGKGPGISAKEVSVLLAKYK
jgi:hypothetical protein